MEAVVVVTAIAVAWLPGALIARLLGLRGGDRIERLAREVAIGLAFWPVAFLLTTSAGLHWTASFARVLLGAIAIALGAVIVRRRGARRRPDAIELAAAALFALVAWTRWAHVRDTVWPLWVDSVHHTMIVRLLVEQGTIPAGYEPFIAHSTFYYHWGFHAFVAVVAWVSGATAPDVLPRVLLIAGQVLNALMFVAVYAGAKALVRDRRASLLAAVLATVVSYFPAYYVSWGRYTQLAGLLILPPLASAFWTLGRRGRGRDAALVSLLAAGLVLVHVRVAALFAVLALVLVIVLAMQKRRRGLAMCGMAAVVAIVAVSPWLAQLRSVPQVGTLLAPDASQHGRWITPNAAPPDLVWAPQNVPLYVMATAGLFALLPFREIGAGWRTAGIVLWLVLVFALWRRSRDASRRHVLARLLVPAAWILLAAIAINGSAAGLPRLVPNSAGVIMLFLPLSIMAGEVLRVLLDAAFRARRRRLAALCLVIVVAIWGASSMTRIVNPQTILVADADRQALRWIRASTPPQSVFAAGVQPWIGGSFIGIDGGYWIALVTDRKSILPPGLYPWVVSSTDADAIGARLERWSHAQNRGDLSILTELRQWGVTYLYFGARNATALRSALSASSAAKRVYDRDGVTIVELTPPETRTASRPAPR